MEYLVVGGTAVAFYGYSRISGITSKQPQVTIDLDFWYKPTLSNYNNLVTALKILGVDVSALSNLVFDPKKTFLKIPRPNFHLDFLPEMTGLDSFSVCKANAKQVNLDGNNIYILGYNDLIKKTGSWQTR
ncbi:MAG: hypothetical protein HRU69_00145 [Flammeovirgaceae bacterium]|nr:MAG: hypothetical protein HRU69_00145 [Flammeovirgaceae bacterium]